NNNATKEQFNDQQKPESSGQRHHSPGVDRKSLEELLGDMVGRPQECICHLQEVIHLRRVCATAILPNVQRQICQQIQRTALAAGVVLLYETIEKAVCIT